MKNKILTVLLSVCLVMTLAACGSENNAEESGEKEEAENEEPETAETNHEGTDEQPSEELAPIYSSFRKFAENINKMTYQEAAEYIETTGLSYTSTAPSEVDAGDIITKNDEYGLHLFVDFSVNEDGADTVCVVSFGNGYFEGYVSDDYHKGDVIYQTYNVYDEENSKEVDSLDKVLAYIEDEIPVLIEEHENREDVETTDLNEN